MVAVSLLVVLNQGWVKIYFMPFKEPILWLGFLANSPRINDFTSFEILGLLGKCGSECRIALNISYFFGA